MRAPAPIDVDRLLLARGTVEARRDLEIRVTSDPRDVAGRLALAALDERIRRPSEALAALEAVEALGGPLGVRWHADDQARLARLIAARGRARLARGAATGAADLARARRLGAVVTDDELRQAQVAGAIVALRHSAAETRAEGRRILAGLAGVNGLAGIAAVPPTGSASSTALAPAGEAAPGGESATAARSASGPAWTSGSTAWVGAQAGAAPDQRARFGVWLWEQGARRAAWDELSAWHAATRAPRDPELQDAYLTAARWWTPFDLPGPPAGELVGPARCAFGACSPREVVGDDRLERGFLAAPLPPPVRDPDDAAALAVITLHQALRGEASWGPALAARVDLAALADPMQLAKLPPHAQPLLARLAGRDAPIPSDGTTPEQRLVIAAERVLAGAGPADIAALVATGPYDAALRRVAAPPGSPAPVTGNPLVEAAARHAEHAMPGAVPPDELRAIVGAYVRDPLIADRLGRDAVASAVDAAATHAILAALFDALGDPARARAAWQAAVDASPEPGFLAGLAEAQARQGDGDAALITAASAAAASGDPGVVWTRVAGALTGSGRYVHALDAARSAIDLSGPETLASALEVASAASRALGRDAQAATLIAQRSHLGPGLGARHAPGAAAIDTDPTDAQGALDAFQHDATTATIARLWTASRWNPRDVALRVALLHAIAADDLRRAELTAELVDLAGDRDPALRRAAVAALH